MGTPVLMLTGHEPDGQWQRFARTLMNIVDRFGVTTMVGLGAYPFGTPHTRPSRLSLSCSSAEVATTLPYLRNSVDVPAGVQAVLERAFASSGKTAIGLWAQVPHYVANMPYPAAAAALLRGLGNVTSLVLGTDALEHDAVAHQQQLDELIAANDEHAAMLRQLELAYDAEGQLALGIAPPIEAADIPSADELAAELERFLREQGR
jgi:predicted ATP-grasp superfamily ATP-dependent carboligase